MTESVIVFDVATLVGLAMVALAVQGAGSRIAKACGIPDEIRVRHEDGDTDG
jgi:hypothetical protein